MRSSNCVKIQRVSDNYVIYCTCKTVPIPGSKSILPKTARLIREENIPSFYGRGGSRECVISKLNFIFDE